MAARSLAETYVSIPELMRLARSAYERAIASGLAAAGIDELSVPGAYLLAYLSQGQESLPAMLDGLGIRRREYGQLIDSLTLRGYLVRPSGAQTMASFALTARGQAAAEIVFEAARAVGRALEGKVSGADIAGLRHGLLALAEIKQSLPKP